MWAMKVNMAILMAMASLPATMLAQTSPTDALPLVVDCAAMSEMASHAAMDHAAHAAAMANCADRQAAPSVSPGQTAFGAIGDVVRLLKADPNTDWSRVNVEALRQHLIDMDDVMMHASIRQRNIAGGVEARVTGTGRTAGAIARMLADHALMLDGSMEYSARATPITSGIRLVVTAKNPADSAAVARVRGLGFAGLLTEGNHHAAHHVALARGEVSPHRH